MTAPNVAPGTGIAGRFSVRSLLGYAGATATFRAVTAQGRDTALKLYSPVIGQRPDAMQQLQRYVAETNALPQDLVGHILEAGYDPATAAPFTVTDIIQAPSLAQFVMRRPMSHEEVGAMLRTLSAVLDASHTRELFHHGLKPTNLFVDPNGPGNVKLTDFGPSLARLLMPTAEGYLLAAPWVAPEQMQAGMPAGAAADVFSAALVAFFALTGRSYWRSCQGAVDVPAWQRELMSPRTAASGRATELGIPLSTALDPLFARALAPDPRERFRSASEFAAALSGFSSRSMESAATLALSPSPFNPGTPPQQDLAAGASGARMSPLPVDDPATQQLDISGSPLAMPMPSATSNVSIAGPPVPVSPTMTSAVAPPRSPWGKAAPITVGIAAVLLLGGAALAWFALGRTDVPAVMPSASATASVPVGVEEPRPAPAASSSAPAAPDAAPTSSAEQGPKDAGADAGENTDPLVQITCVPAPCDAVAIDGKLLKDLEAELRLRPGAHRVSVQRSGHFPKTESLLVKAGTPVEKEITLIAVPAPTAAPAAGQGAATKPCGKFLKRCK